MKKLIISVWAFIALPLFAQRDANIRIYPEQGNQQISKHIYGQFAEHLGTCTDPELTLAGRLLRRRISLDGWNRPQGKSPENGE